ncbi:T9SS type A sorting domain-containing protein [uncultured Algibacter sp.]|uniref:T9SS type A sorting domain-containing protein n=1 Tax=uncultured Algibacter sp. TaxID=298659 RepID=UPI0030EB82EE|tara:strand:- start:1282 stop:2154 length:873 start_codon:yes stop_codon:yes gene_type:complete
MKTKITFLILLMITLSLNAQNIEFTFANAQITNDASFDFYETDVMIAAVEGQADFKLGIGQVYINYNPSAFGNNINAGGGLEITYPAGYILGQVNTLSYYSDFVTNDNSTTRFSFAYQQGISSGSMVDNVTSTPTKLFHIKMQFTDSGQLPMVAFEDNETQPPGVSNSRDQFFTACGPSTGGLGFDDCAGFPGTQFNDALFESGGATLSTEPSELLNVLSVYPNPTEGLLYVGVNTKSKYRVIDIFGKIVNRGSLNQGKNELQLRNYESGIYFLTITNDSGSATKKIVKE